MVTQQETVGQVRLKKPKYLSVCDREERGRGEGAFCTCLDDENCLGGGLYHLYHKF